MAVSFSHPQHPAPGPLVGQALFFIGAAGGQEGGDLAGGGHDLRRQGGAQAGVAHHPEGILAAGQAAGRRWVIGQHRPYPRHDGGQPVALGLDVGPGLLPGDSPGRPGMGGDLAVHGHGVFHHHEGPPGADVVEKHLVEPDALLLQHILHHLHPPRPP